MADASPIAADGLVEGRSCDGCTLCCKLLEVTTLEKPRAQWCSHCDRKNGCRIYDQRPPECGAFYCGFRRLSTIDERWKPSHCKFLINYESDTHRIVLHCDPARPEAWLEAPYIDIIRQWSRSAIRDGSMVIVWTGQKATVVFPDRIKDLGHVRDDQWIIAVDQPSPSGLVRDFIVVEPDDPRVQAELAKEH